MQHLADLLLLIVFSTGAFLYNLRVRIFRKMLTFSTEPSESQYGLPILFPRWKERWMHGAKCDLLDQKREVREVKSLFLKTEEGRTTIIDENCIEYEEKDGILDLGGGDLSNDKSMYPESNSQGVHAPHPDDLGR
jgi:hypothetical protein